MADGRNSRKRIWKKLISTVLSVTLLMTTMPLCAYGREAGASYPDILRDAPECDGTVSLNSVFGNSEYRSGKKVSGKEKIELYLGSWSPSLSDGLEEDKAEFSADKAGTGNHHLKSIYLVSKDGSIKIPLADSTASDGALSNMANARIKADYSGELEFTGFDMSKAVNGTDPVPAGEYYILITLKEELVPGASGGETVFSTAGEDLLIVSDSAGNPPVIKSGSFEGTEGQTFSKTLSAEAAKGGEITWKESASSDTKFSDIGLSLSEDGSINGTLKLKDAGTTGDQLYYISVVATESGNEDKGYKDIAITIKPKSSFRITTVRLPEAALNKEYSTGLRCSMAAEWSIEEGSLPTGLRLDPSTGIISGTPAAGGVYNLKVKASYKSDTSLITFRELKLAVRGDYSRVVIPKDIIDKSKGVSCWLQADFNTKGETITGSWFWSGKSGEEKNGATISSNGAVIVPVKFYGWDAETKFSNVKLMAYVSGENEPVEIAAGSKEEKMVEGGGSTELSSSLSTALTTLPDRFILKDERGKEMEGTLEEGISRDIRVTFSYTGEDGEKKDLMPGETVKSGESFETKLTVFSSLYRKYPDSCFDGFSIGGDAGNTYVSKQDPDEVTFIIPDYKASEVLSGKVLYALSGGEGASGVNLKWYQTFPGGRRDGDTVTDKDGNYEINVYPGADVYLSTPLSYRSDRVGKEEIGSGRDIYVNPGDASAWLDLKVSYPIASEDGDTARYIKALPDSSTFLDASAGGKNLDVRTYATIRNAENNIRFRIWNSSFADILQSLADREDGKKTVRISWQGTSIVNAGSKDTEVNRLLQGRDEIRFPVKGGIVQKVTNKYPVNIRLTAEWFDHATGEYLGESVERDLYGLHTMDIAFPSPKDSGIYDIAVISPEVHPVIKNWKQFNEDYGSDNSFGKYEDIAIESGCGRALPDVIYDKTRVSDQIYITKPRSSASAQAQFSANEIIPVTGTVALDEGFSGKLKGMYITTNTPLECAVIDGKRYPMNGSPSGYITIDPGVTLPCRYTLYAVPRIGQENLELTIWGDINIDKGSSPEIRYGYQLIGEVQVASPGIVMQLPESSGSNMISARLISSPPVDESGKKTEPYSVAIFDGDTQIYSERRCYGIKDRVVNISLLDGFSTSQATHSLSAKIGSDTESPEWMDTVKGEVVIGLKGTPSLKAHYLDLFDQSGKHYDTLMSGRKYDWGPHTAVSYRVRAEFENDEYLDPDYGEYILGEEAPVVFSVKMQNGQSLRLPGKKLSDGVYVSETKKITSAIIQTEVDYGVKRDNMSVENGLDFEAPVRPFTDGVMEQTDIYALNQKGGLSDEKLSMIDVSESKVNADEYAVAYNDENKLYEDIVDNPELYEDMADALEEELLEGGCYYTDPVTGEVDDTRVPEWSHIEGDDSEAPDLAETLDNISVQGSQNGIAVTSLAITLDKERYESELASFMATEFEKSDSPSSEVKAWEGNTGDLKISPGSSGFMAPVTNVVTDSEGNVLLEQTTCFYMSEKDDGSAVMAQVQLTKARRVDDQGNMTNEWDYGEDADIIGIAPAAKDEANAASISSSDRPHRGSYALLFGVKVGCSLDLVSFFIDNPVYSHGSGGTYFADFVGNQSAALNLLVSNALVDGIKGAIQIGENKLGSAGKFWNGVNAAAGLLAAGCTAYSTIAGMKSLADNYYEVESLTKTPCFKAMRANIQKSILSDLDSFHQETNDAMFWTMVHGGFNFIFTLGSTFGINKGTKEALAKQIQKNAAKKMTRTAAGKAAKSLLSKLAAPLVFASAIVVIETSLASLVSLSQTMELDEHRWMLEEWIADSVESEAEYRVEVLGEDESCGYKKKKKDKKDESGNSSRSSSGLESSTYAPIYDPSGVVYAGVKSMPVEGATVKLYKNGAAGLTDDFLQPADPAEISPENNSLTTGADGRYAWMVPAGDWFVAADAEGYISGNSNSDKEASRKGDNYNYLPVPPEQTDVNIPLRSLKAPEAEHVNFQTEGVYVTFDKYMDISKDCGLLKDDAFILNKDDINGDPIPYTVELLDEEMEPDNILESERDSYARNILIKAASPLNVGDKVYLRIDGGILSYAGVRLGDADGTGIWNGTVSEKLTLTAPSLTDDSAKPGRVKQNSEAVFKDSLTGDTKRKANIYYTVDGSDPSDRSNNARKLYDGNPVLIGQSMTIKACAALYGYNDSEVSSFEYEVLQHEKEYYFLESDIFEEDKDNTDTASPENVPEDVWSSAEIGGYTFKWTKSVSYNGRKHYPVILGSQGKNTKSKWGDVFISITDSQGENLQAPKIKAKVKRGRDAGEADMILKLKGKQYRSLNKLLKQIPLKFTIVPADLSDPGLKVEAKFDKQGSLRKVFCTISDKKIRLKKGDFSITGKDNGVVIEGSRNYTGTYSFSSPLSP